ncbi:hypothetical protein BV25DRAFT_1800545 [Artomyces pyxidatus]|uniref:Uncharacterized protein n=1 Tax=Artomyces pyxidatus TaxID=48021 RepID=A0ACB8T7I0_9AGAM|nr:hypothetical protein BV25DRAFT_1800545 [Artomyces pyxidatus]
MSSSVKPTVPRPSASLIVVNAYNEILLVHRNPHAHSFGGMHVFPGGNYDAKQDDSYEMTAVRETFEESGLLLASTTSGSEEILTDAILDEARLSVHAQKTTFKDFLEQHHLTLQKQTLLPFTQWVTPPTSPRRFHTRFFLVFLPLAPASGFSSGNTQHRLPTPDGGLEVVAARFVHPADALAEFRKGEIALMPPQYYLLTTLADILQGRVSDAAQRGRVETLAAGAFGRMVVGSGSLVGVGRKEEVVLAYDDDEARGGPKGRLHRCVMRIGKQGIPQSITLFRNFDIFTDIYTSSSTEPAKL